MVLGFVVGCLVSLPALRLRGVYLALVTLGVAVLFPTLIVWRKLEWLTQGARGINSIAYKDIPNWPLFARAAQERRRPGGVHVLAGRDRPGAVATSCAAAS